jgi:hypothetical protein
LVLFEGRGRKGGHGKASIDDDDEDEDDTTGK